MRSILTGASLALLLVFSNACTKEATKIANNSTVHSSTTSLASTTLVGRQQLITLPTGDYTYPTSQALLWLPYEYSGSKSISTDKKYPLIISLVGVGENGTDINSLLGTENIAKRIADGWNPSAINPVSKATFKFIVFTPQCPAQWGWSAPHIKTMLANLEANYRIDPSRVYITGYSAGGWGLWSCITDDESLCKQFAAIVPVSTASADHPDKITNVDKYGIACWNICGTGDSFYTNAVNYTNTINNNKPPIKAILTGLPGVGHSAWIQAYDPTWTSYGLNFYQWLLQYHK